MVEMVVVVVEEGGCYGVGLVRAGDAQERLLL